MNPQNYRIRRAESDADCARLEHLFERVFDTEPVGVLAAIMFRHLPGLAHRYWFIAEEQSSGQIVAAFVLIPWQWQWQGIPLKVAEQGIVATDEAHRGQGLQKRLNAEFDQVLAQEGFDLAVIQGIPGFYHKFGFHFALPIENHINLEWRQIPDSNAISAFDFRPANTGDVPFLMEQDKRYQRHYDCSTQRDAAGWHYLLSHSQQTEYGSEYWIAEQGGKPCFYLRLPEQGFGDGQILSECSQDLTYEHYLALLQMAKQRGLARGKPYLRLNLHNDSQLGHFAQGLGAKAGEPYGWQTKIPDLAAWLNKLTPVLEARLQDSCLARYSGVLRLDSFGSALDMVWNDGQLQRVGKADGDSTDGACIPPDLLPALILGAHTWRQLRQVRPDIFTHGERSALLLDTLFPAVKSWHYMQY